VASDTQPQFSFLTQLSRLALVLLYRIHISPQLEPISKYDFPEFRHGKSWAYFSKTAMRMAINPAWQGLPLAIDLNFLEFSDHM